MKATACSQLIPEAPPSRKSRDAQGHPGDFLGTPERPRRLGCRGRPGPREGAERSGRAEVGGDSPAGVGAGGSAPNPARGSGPAPRDHRGQRDPGRRPGSAPRGGPAWGRRRPGDAGPRGLQVRGACGRPWPGYAVAGAGAGRAPRPGRVPLGSPARPGVRPFGPLAGPGHFQINYLKFVIGVSFGFSLKMTNSIRCAQVGIIPKLPCAGTYNHPAGGWKTGLQECLPLRWATTPVGV